MWIGSKLGFFSIVKKGQPNTWQIRARCERDLRGLLSAAGLNSDVTSTPHADYAFSTVLDVVGLDQVFATFSASVDYPDFKSCIDSLPHQRDKLAAYEDFCTGMRKFQAAAVSIPNFDPNTAEMEIKRKIAKRYGGYLARVLETLNGFRDKYGAWPTKLRLPTVALEALRELHLTPPGFEVLESRLQLIVGEYEDLTAEDDAGLKFDYTKEGWSGKRPAKGADQWLWNVTF